MNTGERNPISHPGEQKINFPAHVKVLFNYLARQGISNEVALAVAITPRDVFLPHQYRPLAFLDRPLPNYRGQRISEFSLVARMTNLLRLSGTEKVLEIGTGSGYQTAILARLAKEVVTIEEIGRLSQLAQKRLAKLGLEKNVDFVTGDGSGGFPKFAPYDRILLTCGVVWETEDALPQPLNLMREQLTDEGTIITPLGALDEMLIFVIPKQGQLVVYPTPVLFQPLRGEYGFKNAAVNSGG